MTRVSALATNCPEARATSRVAPMRAVMIQDFIPVGSEGEFGALVPAHILDSGLAKHAHVAVGACPSRVATPLAWFTPPSGPIARVKEPSANYARKRCRVPSGLKPLLGARVGLCLSRVAPPQ